MQRSGVVQCQLGIGWECIKSTRFIFLSLLAHYPIVLLPLAALLLAGYGAVAVLEHGWSKHAVWSILVVIFFTHG